MAPPFCLYPSLYVSAEGLQVGNDSSSEVVGRRVASHIHRADLARVDDIVGSGSDVVSDGIEAKWRIAGQRHKV